MTDTVNYAYADDVFGESTCMKNFFGLQEEMHHAFKATVINNRTKNDMAGILPEPKTLQDLFNVSSEVKIFWINAVCREITTTVEFKVFNANVTPRAGEQVIPIKMLFKIKFDENGNIDKFKVRARRDFLELWITFHPGYLRHWHAHLGDSYQNQLSTVEL